MLPYCIFRMILLYYTVFWFRIGAASSMNDRIEVFGIQIDLNNADAALKRTEEFLQTDSLSTAGIVTMEALLAAAENPVQKEYLEQLDLAVIGDTEVLEAAGIHSGQIYEQTEENECIARIFWKLINGNYTFFLLGENRQEVRALETYVKETYPDINVCGQAFQPSEEEHSEDWIVNEINGSGADVIISGLNGFAQTELLLENRSKINGKIWLTLGEQAGIRKEAGMKQGWLSSRRRKSSFKRLAAKFRNEEND